MTIDGQPWFVATDLYAALFGRTTGIASKHFLEDHETWVVQKESASGALRSVFTGRAARVALLAESTLYKLVLRSDKQSAKAFQDWVTRDVLPAIRKDGGYVLREEKVASGDMSTEQLEAALLQMAAKKLARLESENKAMKEELNLVTVDEYRALSRRGPRTGRNARICWGCEFFAPVDALRYTHTYARDPIVQLPVHLGTTPVPPEFDAEFAKRPTPTPEPGGTPVQD